MEVNPCGFIVAFRVRPRLSPVRSLSWQNVTSRPFPPALSYSSLVHVCFFGLFCSL